MLKKRIFLHLIITVLSAFISLSLVYFVVGKFDHYRYWSVTAVRIQENEIKLISGMLPLLEIDSFTDLKKAKTDFKRLIEPLKNKLPITISYEDKVFIDSVNPNYRLKESSIKEVPFGNFKFTFGIYAGPTWNSQFIKFLKRPNRWFTSKYDFITINAVTFFLISYFVILSMLWRYRANYLGKDILKTLNQINKND